MLHIQRLNIPFSTSWLVPSSGSGGYTNGLRKMKARTASKYYTCFNMSLPFLQMLDYESSVIPRVYLIWLKLPNITFVCSHPMRPLLTVLVLCSAEPKPGTSSLWGWAMQWYLLHQAIKILLTCLSSDYGKQITGNLKVSRHTWSMNNI